MKIKVSSLLGLMSLNDGPVVALGDDSLEKVAEEREEEDVIKEESPS